MASDTKEQEKPSAEKPGADQNVGKKSVFPVNITIKAVEGDLLGRVEFVGEIQEFKIEIPSHITSIFDLSPVVMKALKTADMWFQTLKSRGEDKARKAGKL